MSYSGRLAVSVSLPQPLEKLILQQLTYSFPPLLALGYDIRLNAMKVSNGGFDPATGGITRRYKGLSYWVKGYFSGGALQVIMNVWHTVYALGSLALAALGLYAAIQGIARRP
jgi:hypothetical protein